MMPNTSRRRGAAGSQYALILGLIAVAALAAVGLAGQSIRQLLTSTANRLSIANNESASGSGASGGDSGGCAIARVSCRAHLLAGCTTSGAYSVDGDGAGPLAPLSLACDMTADGGGWTLIAKNSTVDASVFSSNLSAGYLTANLSSTAVGNGMAPGAAIAGIFQSGDYRLRYHVSGTPVAYYRRWTSPTAYNPAPAIIAWTSGNAGALNTDFSLYSSHAALLADTGRWSYCNYDPSAGMPLDCGPSGAVTFRWFDAIGTTPNAYGFSTQVWAR